MKHADEFEEVFQALRAILAKHADQLIVHADVPGDYYLNTTKLCKKRPMFFGAVRTGKRYASFHLMPVYVCTGLKESISDELRQRMQGKACFNFRSVDKKLFKELAALTRKGLQMFKRGGWA